MPGGTALTPSPPDTEERPVVTLLPPVVQAEALPQGLEGSSIPDGLMVDRGGHLVRSLRVRDVFDYFLAAGNERSLEQIDAMVEAHLVSRLKAPALGEARDLWNRYRDYLARAQAHMQRISGVAASGNGEWRRFLEERSLLRRRMLPDVADLWFASEEAAERLQIEQLDILNNRSISAAERIAAIEAIQMRDPVHRQAVRDGGQLAAIGDLVDRMRAQGASPAAIADAVAARSGDQAAARVRDWVQRDMAWETRYARYRSASQQLAGSGVSGAALDSRMAELRTQYFPNPAERLRAQGRDRSKI